MRLDEPNELLILKRSFKTKDGMSHLTAPSSLMVQVTDLMLTVFQENFDNIKSRHQVVKTLVDIARSKLTQVASEWLAVDKPCSPHREFLLRYCMKLKIQKQTVWLSKAMRIPKSEKSTSSQKVTNVQNL